MSCFNCKKMHHKCKAECCGVVPIPKKTYESNIPNIVRKPIDILETDDAYIPITEDAYCVFLNTDLSCNIYEDRPDICRKFGDESHPMLCCPVLDKNGKERSRQNRLKLFEEQSKIISKLGMYHEKTAPPEA